MRHTDDPEGAIVAEGGEKHVLWGSILVGATDAREATKACSWDVLRGTVEEGEEYGGIVARTLLAARSKLVR